MSWFDFMQEFFPQVFNLAGSKPLRMRRSPNHYHKSRMTTAHQKRLASKRKAKARARRLGHA